MNKQNIREIGFTCILFGGMTMVLSLIQYSKPFIAIGGILMGLGISYMARGLAERKSEKTTSSENGQT